jgi:hypothetical protein
MPSPSTKSVILAITIMGIIGGAHVAGLRFDLEHLFANSGRILFVNQSRRLGFRNRVDAIANLTVLT